MPPPKRKPGRPRKNAELPPLPSKGKVPVTLARYIAQMNDYKPVEWIRSGIPAIDLAIGAGIPRGRFIEVLGDPATAKSAFGYAVIGAFQRAGGQCVLLDSESKTDRTFAEMMGVDWTKLGYSRAENINACVKHIGNISRLADPKIPTLIVWDSIASTPGADELDGILEDKGLGSEKAKRARQLSEGFRSTLGELSHKGVTLLGINQTRTTFNFMSAYTTLESTGGRSIKYHAAVRMIMKGRGRIRHKDRDIVVGQQIEVEVLKSAMAVPFRKAMLRFFFETGFQQYSGLDELLLRHGRIEQKAGWLVYKDRSFRAGDIERIVVEIPELLEPLKGVLERSNYVPGMPPSDAPKEEAPLVAETVDAEADL